MAALSGPSGVELVNHAWQDLRSGVPLSLRGGAGLRWPVAWTGVAWQRDQTVAHAPTSPSRPQGGQHTSIADTAWGEGGVGVGGPPAKPAERPLLWSFLRFLLYYLKVIYTFTVGHFPKKILKWFPNFQSDKTEVTE